MIVYRIKKWLKKKIIDLAFYFHKYNKNNYKIAETEEEKNRIYHLRYQIYINELGRDLPILDTKEKMVKDELDDLKNSIHYYHEENGEIVAALRITIFLPNQMPKDFKDLYAIKNYPWIDNYTWCEVSYAVVSKKLRSKIFYAKFLLSIFTDLAKNVQFILGSCKPYLLPRYRLLGGNTYTKEFIKCPDGIQIPLLWVSDSRISKRISSPFRVITPAKRDCIIKEHADDITLAKHSVIVKKEEILKELLSLKKNKPFLQSFDSILLEYLIDHDCYILCIDTPTKIIHSQMKDKTMYLLLDGEINLSLSKQQIDLKEGDIVGEFSYFNHLGDDKHQVDVECKKGKLFVIHKSAIHTLSKHSPKQYSEFLHLIIQSQMSKTRAFLQM